MVHIHFEIPMLYPMRFQILEALCDQLPVYQLKSSYLEHRRQLADQSESLTEYVQCHTECDAMAIERMQPGLLQRPEPMDLFESLLKTGSFVEAARLCHVMTPYELTQAMTTYGQMEHSYRALKLNDLYKAYKASIQTMSVRTEKFVKSIANYPKVVAVSCLDEPLYRRARLNVLVKHRRADLLDELIALTDLEVFILSQLEVHLPAWRFTTLKGYNMEGFVSYSMHLYDDTTRTLACDVCHHVAESQLRGVGNICLYHQCEFRECMGTYQLADITPWRYDQARDIWSRTVDGHVDYARA